MLELIAAGLALPRVLQSSRLESFAGTYSDPNHPGACCLRVVIVKDGVATITSRDSIDESVWSLSAALDAADPTHLVIDFSPKGGPEDLSCELTADGDILFEDGNTWTRTSGAAPKAMRAVALAHVSSLPASR